MIRSLTALCIACTAGTAFAQETFTLPDDFATLQEVLDPAISGIDPGDIIVLRDTVDYVGTFEVDVPDLTIRAAEGDSPVLDANGAGSVITVNIGDSRLTLEGLTIQDGVGRGAGIDVINAGDLTIRGCTIRDNTRSGGVGGGVFGRNLTVFIEDSLFEGNSANAGGALSFRDTVFVTITDSQFIDNTASGSDGGGAIEYVGNDLSTFLISGSTFSGNSGGGRGGAAYIENSALVRITDSTFSDNFALNSNESDGGALLTNAVESLVIRSCTFERNLCGDGGGAIFTRSGTNDTVQVIDTRFIENESSDAGAVLVFGGRVNDYINCEFIGNTANRSGDGPFRGGAMAFRQVDDGNRAFVRVFNSLFEGNTAARGGAIDLAVRCTVEIVNSTFVDNVANTAGGAIQASATGVSARIYNNVFANNLPADNQVNIITANELEDASFNLFTDDGLVGGGGNNIFNADPLFVDPSNRDYSLQAGSPAIDAGSTSLYVGGPLSDLAGNERGQDDPNTTGTGEAIIGNVIDMGAFEFNVNADADACPADFDNNGEADFGDLIEFLDLLDLGC